MTEMEKNGSDVVLNKKDEHISIVTPHKTIHGTGNEIILLRIKSQESKNKELIGSPQYSPWLLFWNYNKLSVRTIVENLVQ